MPTSKLSTLWLAAAITNGRRILFSDDSMAIYGLPARPFEVGTYRDKSYRPAGLADQQISNLSAFLEHAAQVKSIEALVKFIEGKGETHSGDSLGRSLFRAWFTSAHMYNKINDIWDHVLADKQCRPQDLIADNAAAIREDEDDSAVFGTVMPPSAGARALCDELLVEALFGDAAMGRRTVDPNVLYCLAGFWHHEWERYRKIRNGALEKHQRLREVWEEKRDGEFLQCSIRL